MDVNNFGVAFIIKLFSSFYFVNDLLNSKNGDWRIFALPQLFIPVYNFSF